MGRLALLRDERRPADAADSQGTIVRALTDGSRVRESGYTVLLRRTCAHAAAPSEGLLSPVEPAGLGEVVVGGT